MLAVLCKGLLVGVGATGELDHAPAPAVSIHDEASERAQEGDQYELIRCADDQENSSFQQCPANQERSRGGVIVHVRPMH